VTDVTATGFDRLLEHIRVSRGFDFTGYKRASLERRVTRRLQAVEIADVEEYIDYLEVHPEEFALLFDTILINVTSFFRDAAAWTYLREEAVPRLLAAKPADEPIRVWSAGTASGEEAYSLAMVLADALGDDVFRDRVKIYATDVDEDALNDARQGVYPMKVGEDVPDDLAQRYLKRTDHRYTFAKELRRAVIFGRNDLVQDAPISRVDLLTCRNTLMYFTAETQARILGRFHFALRDHGLLFLGKSEMLLTRSALFEPVELKFRVFAKLPKPEGRRLAFPPADAAEAPTDAGRDDEMTALRDATWQSGPVPEIVVDLAGRLAMANAQARRLFSLDRADIGRRFSDLEISYRPVELRSAIKRSAGQEEPLRFADVEWSRGEGDQRRLEVQVQPLRAGSLALGTAVVFHDVTEHQRLQYDLERSRRELEVAYEELQSTVEELETTNEELQSTNEELETTNEELQSTNEELETMNEELQSTNEELETTNDELRRRTGELHGVNAFLETVLTSLAVGVVALDAGGRVRLWNARSEDLWGLREDEVVEQHLLGLDIGLPVERLKGPLHAALGGEDGVEVELDALNRRGRPMPVRVTVRPLRGATDEVDGAILLVEERGGDRIGVD
jgi:two-component system, chemotaxis family, CheB/CheR fusion protein